MGFLLGCARFLRAARLAWVVSFTIMLSACHSDPPKDWVAEQWDKTMDVYHIFPVYPPSEDVHVGDVYGVTTEKFDDNPAWQEASVSYGARLDNAVKLDGVNMTTELEAYYTKFPVFPSTSDPPADGKIWVQQDAKAPGKPKGKPNVEPVAKPVKAAAKGDKKPKKPDKADPAPAKPGEAVTKDDKTPEKVAKADPVPAKPGEEAKDDKKPKQVAKAGPAPAKPGVVPAKPAEAGDGNTVPAGDTDGDLQSVFTPATMLTKLPIAALPGFTIARATSVSAGASVPLKFLKLLGYGSAQSDLAVSIKVRSAEVYGVPVAPAYLKLVDFCTTTGVCSEPFIREMIYQQTGYRPKTTQVFIINRVYLTRSIEYVYDKDSVIGAQGKALVDLRAALANQQNLIKELDTGKGTASTAKAAAEATKGAADASKIVAEAAKSVADAAKANAESSNAIAEGLKKTVKTGDADDKPVTPKKPAADKPDAKPDATPPTNQQMADLKKQMQTLLDSVSAGATGLEGSPVPGATFSIGSVSENGISIVQTFERPVAIGYRSVRLQVPLTRVSSAPPSATK